MLHLDCSATQYVLGDQAGMSSLSHHLPDQQDCAWIHGGAVEALGFVHDVFVFREDGGFVGLVGMNFDLHRVLGIREIAANEEGG